MSRRSILLVILCFVVVILLVGAFFTRGFLRRKMYGDMTSEEIKRFKEWRDEVPSLPPGVLDVAPLQEATISARKTFVQNFIQFEKIAEMILLNVPSFRAFDRPHDRGVEEVEALDDIHIKLQKVAPLIESFENLVTQADYEIDLIFPYEYDHKIRRARYFMVMLLGLKAMALLRNGEHSQALRTAENIVRSGTASGTYFRPRPLMPIMWGARTWHAVVKECDDPVLLRETLQRQNVLVPGREFTTFDPHPSTLRNIAIIRSAKRFGIEMDIQGMTRGEITFYAFLVQVEYRAKVFAPLLESQPFIAGAKSKSEEFRRTTQLPSFVKDIRNLFEKTHDDVSVVRIFYEILHEDIFDESSIWKYHSSKTALVEFDRLRLFTASKIYRLEKGYAPESPADLVPEYLPEVPKDPFGKPNEPYRTEPFLHSVGPDRIDQQGFPIYDSTNGTRSSGDIPLIELPAE